MRYPLVLVLATACRLQAQAVPAAAPELPRYDLTVTLDFKAARLQVDAQVTLPPADQDRSSISFALSELFPDPKVQLLAGRESFDSLRIEKFNRPYSRARWGTNTWRLVPSRPIPAGRPVTLRVNYAGSGDLKSLVFSLGERVAFAAGQTTAWYPEIEETEPHPAGRLRGLRGTGTLTFLVDSGVVVYTAGRQDGIRQDGGRQVLRYRVAKPMYFAFAAAPYVVTNGTYYLKARPGARSDGTRARTVLRTLEREFGPYPFERFAVVEVPTTDADQAGFAGASADGLIMATPDFIDQPFNTAYYGHEIGHQWWGVTVRPTGPRGTWMLSEAMAQYGSLRAVEAIDGPGAAERYRRDQYPGYLDQGGKLYFRTAAAGHDTALADLPLDGEWSRDLADSKGFMVWNALSLELGRAAFARILADVVARYSTTRITWDLFLAQVSRRAQRDLSWFYTQWFDRPGVPNWRIVTADSAGTPRSFVMQDSLAYRVTVRVDVTTERCARATTHVVLQAAPAVLPNPGANCGRPSYVIDPAYEIIHWTPELRREFGERPRP
jgi:hypothetical protein